MRCKALILLFLFLLNTATGFACALLMSGHEQIEATGHHEAGEAAEHHNDHNRNASLANQHHHVDRTSIAAEDDLCCQKVVDSFNSLAKVVPLSNHFDLHSPFIYVAVFFLFFLNRVAVVRKVQSMALFKRRRPPTQPIRVIIQSFQI